MKKVVITSFVFIFLISTITKVAWGIDTPPDITADSIVLMDATTGQILYSKNPDVSYPPASTTKTMTALLAIEKCNMDDIVTISKNPAYIDGSKAGINEGEKLKVKDLLYGLILVSGNDCAEALAEHIAGSSSKFAEMMTLRAKELGCKNTNFVNPSGLYDEKHKTSASDLALIMKELSKYAVYREISTTPSYKMIPLNKPDIIHTVWNENRMIHKNDKYFYPGCEGGKTGYTTQSLFSFTAMASRNNQRLIVAMIHNKFKTHFTDAKLLLDYGFNNFELVKLYSKGDKVQNYNVGEDKLSLISTEDFYFTRQKGTTEVPTLTIENSDLTNKSFKEGEAILKGTVYTGANLVGNIALASDTDHILNTKFQIINAQKNSKIIVPIILIISSIVLVAFAIIFRRLSIKKKNKSELKL